MFRLLQALVYDKSLRLSRQQEEGVSAGTAVNHMSVDALHIFFFYNWVHFVWSIPLQVGMG